jgi:hypothetical protein
MPQATEDELLALADMFDSPPTANPWPEDSDYGKRWRRGYNAGRSDAQAKAVAALLRARASTQEQQP